MSQTIIKACRQIIYQLKQVAKGLCRKCSRPLAEGNKYHCEYHAKKASEDAKRYYWKKVAQKNAK